MLKKVIGYRLDRQEAQELQQRLDAVYDSCSCRNDQVRINHIVKILKDEERGAREVFLWFIEVLRDRDVNKPELVYEIEIRIKGGTGPKP